MQFVLQVDEAIVRVVVDCHVAQHRRNAVRAYLLRLGKIEKCKKIVVQLFIKLKR